MPRILVADDNSNIQKMVALALKDQGIEVVGVGNGEAAVRKVPEITPDVILADVFMPVRSGYEVCEFVKNDSRYMHTPVVLLVGAFDPLDEHEAQRVRADGVLKKPFVPPEPLINLVKALLVKSAGERLAAVGVTTAPAAVKVEIGRAKTAPEKHEPDFSDQPAEQLPVPALPSSNLKVGDYESPVAFGALLETPAMELPALDETDPIVTSSRDPNLGEPAFWSHAAQTEKEAPVEEGEPTEHSWGHAESLPGMDESAVFDPIEPIELDHEAARTRSLEIAARELEEEAPDTAAISMIEPLEVTQEAKIAPSIEKDPATLAVDTPAETASVDGLDLPPAATVIEWPHPEDSLPAAVPISSATAGVPVESTPIAVGPDPALEPPVGSEAPAVSTSVDPILASTAEQAAELQANWRADLEPESKAAPESQTENEPEAEIESAETTMEDPNGAVSWPPAFRPAPPPAEMEKPAWTTKLPAVRPQASEPVPVPVITSLIPIRAPETTEASTAVPGATAASAADLTKSTLSDAAASVTLSPEMLEAVVTRIVDRMQPKIIEMVTREILRPVVEALVRREIDKK